MGIWVYCSTFGGTDFICLYFPVWKNDSRTEKEQWITRETNKGLGIKTASDSSTMLEARR